MFMSVELIRYYYTYLFIIIIIFCLHTDVEWKQIIDNIEQYKFVYT